MHIAHIALYTTRPDIIKSFYCKWFNGKAGNKYTNPKTGFESYFIEFDTYSCRLEIMYRPGIRDKINEDLVKGLSHMAFSAGSIENVDKMTNEMKNEGITIISNPRKTGDGYYESVIEDPDGNWIEITV